MSRRTCYDESKFGSDSFLDVICNVVGILIILIVAAGIKASQAPVVPETVALPDASAPVASPTPPPAPSVAPSKPEKEESRAAEPIRPAPKPVLLTMPPPPAPEVRIELSPELLAEEHCLKSDLKGLRDAQAADAALKAQLARDQDHYRALADTARRQLNERKKADAQSGAGEAALRQALKESQERLLALDVALKQHQAEGTPAKTIQHKLTPISRVVHGTERHFRCLNNRVAYVPLEELTKRLGPQIEKQKDWLVKYRRHQGEVGPVDGFSLRYVVERAPATVLDSLGGHNGVMRISVSQWELVPEPELKSETAEEALSRHSAFIRALRIANPDDTLTFWVYPDSYKVYRALQQFAHEEGFMVAARPLPAGVPITGSPSGSRSAGQ